MLGEKQVLQMIAVMRGWSPLSAHLATVRGWILR